jgi:sec-independent protein translocase protein TatA
MAQTAGLAAFCRFTIGCQRRSLNVRNREFMNAMFALLGLSGTELLVVLVVILVLFGAKRIPEFAKGLGKGIDEFKKASREVTDSIENDASTPPPAAPKPVAPINTTPQTQTQPATHPPETKVV